MHSRQIRLGARVRAKRRFRVFTAIGLVILGLPAGVPVNVDAGHDDEYIETISAERTKKLLDGGEKVVFIDLRPAGDFQKTHLPGALSIPISELPKRLSEIPKAGRVILYCTCPPGGVDESYSYLMLRGKGYRNVAVLENGFSSWAQQKFPTESK